MAVPPLKSFVGVGVPGPRGPAGPPGGADLGFQTKEELEERVVELVQENAPEPAALAEVVTKVAALETATAGVVKSVNGQQPDGAGNLTVAAGGTTVLAASATLSLDNAGRKLYLPYTVTGALTIAVTGSTPGAEADMVVIANGTNTPTVTGADAWLSNFGYITTNGARNMLSVWHDGDGRRYAWSQQEIINAPAPGDTTAPVFQSAAIANATPSKIVLTYNEPLSSTLTGSLTLGGPARTVSSATVVGSTVEVTVNAPYVSGDAPTVSAPAGYVRDTTGNAALALTGQAVTNNVAAAADTTAPTVGTPTVANATPTKITVPFSETLSATLTGSAAVNVNGSPVTVNGASVVGSSVEITLATAIISTDSVTVSAPAGWVRDAAGNTSAVITGLAVTNNVSAGGGAEDALTTSYRSRAGVAGVTLNETHVGYADTFAKALRAAGIHNKFTALNLAINDTLAASLVKFIGSTSDTSAGTVTFDPALGWSTDGTSGRINTGVQAVAGNWGQGAYLRTAQASENVARALIGSSSATDAYRLIGNRTPGTTAGTANGNVSNLHGTLVGFANVAAGGFGVGAWTSIRRSSSNVELFKNGASQNLNTATAITGAADVPSGFPITVMALNVSGGVPSSYLAAGTRVAGYWITDGTMTASDEAAFYSALQAFQTSMGRAV